MNQDNRFLKHDWRLKSFFLVVVWFLSATVMATEITPHTIWNLEVRNNVPDPLRWWLHFLFASFGLGLLFVWKHVMARWVVAAFVVVHLMSATEMLLLGTKGIPVGFIAINHCVVWTPAAIYLIRKGNWRSYKTPFEWWRTLILAVILVSLFFDYRDAALFLFTDP